MPHIPEPTHTARRATARSIDTRLWQHDPAARTLFRAAAGGALLAAGCTLAVAWLLSDIVSGVLLEHRSLSDAGASLGLIVVLLFARAGLMWAGDVGAQLSANRLKRELRRRLTASLFALGPTFVSGERTGELVHTAVEGVEQLDEYIKDYLRARILAGLVPALVFLVILVADPWTLPILLFTGPILVLLFALIGSRTAELTGRRFVEMSWMSAHFLDMLQGLPSLKLFGRSKEQIRTIEAISRRNAGTTMDVLRTAFQTSLVLEWGATAATALVAIEVSVRLMSGLMPFQLALGVLLVTPEFFLPLRQLAINYHAGAAGRMAAERAYAIMDLPGAVGAAMEAPPVACALLPARHDFVFDDIRVAYDNGQRPALDGFSLRIAHGQTVALVGPTGAGKTTVAHLLLRFVEPVRGRISAGGVSLQQIDVAHWRAQIAWVPQQPHLMYGTIAENLAVARPGASPEALIAAARAAHAHEFIERLPLGYDTPLGEDGARLSGGQRQRIAIARAFLKDAPLLVLDEATSQLDSESEALVQDALARLMRERTVLVIAHRLLMAERADLVAVMDGGRIVQQGSPWALTSEDGRYRRMRAAYEEQTPCLP